MSHKQLSGPKMLHCNSHFTSASKLLDHILHLAFEVVSCFYYSQPHISVVVRSKAQVCSRFIFVIAGSNPTDFRDVNPYPTNVENRVSS